MIYMTSNNTNVVLGVVVCSPYTRCFVLKDIYHKNIDMCGYTPLEYNYLETLEICHPKNVCHSSHTK